MTDSLLRYAYIETPCNACGGIYRLTLQDILMEQRLEREWQPARACNACSVSSEQRLSAIPPELIERLGVAWEAVAKVAEGADSGLRVGP